MRESQQCFLIADINHYYPYISRSNRLLDDACENAFDSHHFLSNLQCFGRFNLHWSIDSGMLCELMG